MDQNSMYRLVLQGRSVPETVLGSLEARGQLRPCKATLHDFFAKAAGVQHVEEPVPTVVKAEQPAGQPVANAGQGALPAPPPTPKAFAPPAPPVPKPAAPPKSEPTMPKARPVAQAEPVVIRDMEDPPLRVTLEDGRIVFTTLSDKNRRLSKYSVLAEFAEGRMTSDLPGPASGVSVFPWEVSPKSMACTDGKIQSLASLIKDRKLQSVYLHEACTEGVPPKELKPRASS
eukprot:s2541_g22.t1